MKIIFLLFGIIVINTVLCFSQLPSYIPQQGLSGYWQFNGNANDASGLGNNGTVNGAIPVNSKTGQANQAYYFDGIDDNIVFPNPMLGGQQVSSFALFFRIKKENQNYMNLWGKSLFWGELYVELKQDNVLQIFWANSNGGNRYSVGLTPQGTILPNVWYDIIINYNNSLIKIYVNGQEVNTQLSWVAQGGTLLSTTQVGSLANFAQDIGSNQLAAGSTFKGTVDEMGIWNRALTQTEINAIYSPANICAPPKTVRF